MSGETNAITALRAHILASAGAGHGPRNASPDGFDAGTLVEHVFRVDGRGGPG